MRSYTDIIALFPAEVQEYVRDLKWPNGLEAEHGVTQLLSHFSLPPLEPGERMYFEFFGDWNEYTSSDVWTKHRQAERATSQLYAVRARQQLFENLCSLPIADFYLHGYGSGDSSSGCDFNEGGNDVSITMASQLDDLGWELADSTVNDDGGGYRMYWDAALKELRVEGYYNISGEEPSGSTTLTPADFGVPDA